MKIKGLPYRKYKEIFPPRPANAVPQTSIVDYDDGTFAAQPKLDGSNCSIYMNGIDVFILNRHKERMTNFQISKEELLELYTGSDGEWMIINGEYLNKNKDGESDLIVRNKVKGKEKFNHKLIIFDILVLKGKYLIGRTFGERIEMLDGLYGMEDSEVNELYTVNTGEGNIYRVKTYFENFTETFERLIKTEVYEGLVMKRLNAKLERGLTEGNNTNSQIKARRPTKNYQF